MNWPLLLDDTQNTYRAYGLERANWWNLYNPLSIIRYLILMLSGRRPGKPGRDWHQLGGDIAIDPEGIIRLHHVSENPHDRPKLKTILGLILSDEPSPNQ